MASGITLTEIDPATLPTPDVDKDTIFMDATASPPAPAFMDSGRGVTSLIGPAGPVGPAGPTGSISVNPNGALDGDGSGGSPLGVRVDGTTIGINASNELEALGAGSGTVTHTGTLTSGKAILGNGGGDITVSSLTADLVSSAAGTPSGVTVRQGLTLAGGNLDVNVDNETIGLDSHDKLQVIAAYVSQASVRRGLTYAAGSLDVNVDNETIGIDSSDKLQVIAPYIPGGAVRRGLTYSGGYLDVAAGAVLQVVNTLYTTKATGTTAIPVDDTIPQITEGDEYFTGSITPKYSTSKLRIDVTIYVAHSTSGVWLFAGIWQDTTANCLAGGFAFSTAATAVTGHPTVFRSRIT